MRKKIFSAILFVVTGFDLYSKESLCYYEWVPQFVPQERVAPQYKLDSFVKQYLQRFSIFNEFTPVVSFHVMPVFEEVKAFFDKEIKFNADFEIFFFVSNIDLASKKSPWSIELQANDHQNIQPTLIQKINSKSMRHFLGDFYDKTKACYKLSFSLGDYFVTNENIHKLSIIINKPHGVEVFKLSKNILF